MRKIMKQYLQLTKRNCLVYARDRGAVFFSLLSMLIVLMLMGIFLGNMNQETITDLLTEYGGMRDLEADKENARHLVQYWTLAGILVINAVTVTLAVMTTMVKDAAARKLESFYCTPVSKFCIAISYITSSVVLGMLLCLIPFAVALLYIAATGGELLSAVTILKLIGCIFLNVIIFSIIMYLAAALTKSVSAWSGMGTIIGTLVGFVGAVYLPMGQLPDKVGTVLKCLPILHGTALTRKLCCEDIVAKTFDGLPEEVVTEYNKAMGITIWMDEKILSSQFQVGFLIICGMIALGFILLVTKKRRRNEER